MDSSDEEFLPDPERYRRKREPPDKDDANKQRGLILHDDSTKGRCFFTFCVFV